MKPVFTNKVAWITGASSGIGEELAYAFSRKGARLILSSRNEAELERVKNNCVDAANVIIHPVDLSDRGVLESKAVQALNYFGGVDYLVLNAGILARDFAINIPLEIDRDVMQTNYFGSVAITKSVLPSMVSKGSGQIVVISSLSGKFGVPKLSAYAASKHALHGFFDSLRAEVLPSGIKVSVIIPGFINTPIINKGIDGNGVARNSNLAVNEKGMHARKCAEQIITAIRKGKQEALVGGMETYSVILNRFFPGLFRKTLRNHPIRKLKSIFPWLFK